MTAARKLLAKGGGTTFAPDDIAGLVGWWDASDAATITDTGGLVDTWADKSSAGRDATGVTTARPTTGAATQNSLNVLTFDGGDRLSFTAFAFGNAAAQAVTVFVVGKKDAVTNANVFLNDGGTTTYLAFATSSSTGAPYGRRNTAVTVTSSANLATTTYAVVRFADTAGTTGAITVGFNGGNTSTGNGNTGDGSWSAIGYYNAGGFPLDGAVAEVLIYDSVLSGSDLTDVDTYLNDKWAVY